MIADLLADLQPAIDVLVVHGYPLTHVRALSPTAIFERAAEIERDTRRRDDASRADRMVDAFWAHAGSQSTEANAAFHDHLQALLGQPSHLADPDAEPDIEALERAGVLTEEDPHA